MTMRRDGAVDQIAAIIAMLTRPPNIGPTLFAMAYSALPELMSGR